VRVISTIYHVCVNGCGNQTPSSLALAAMCVDGGGGGDRGCDCGHGDHLRHVDADACDTNTETFQNRHHQMTQHLQTHQLAIQTGKGLAKQC
jgi:hypothetical protein